MGLTTKEISSSSFNDMISSVDRRSEYVENRAGANVRLNNFLTPYTLDDKSSILNAPCGYSNGVYPSLRPVQTFGPELIDLTQGTAEQPSQWSNITTNSVNFLPGAAGVRYFNVSSTNGTLISGRKYSLTLEISNYSGSQTLGISTQGNVSHNARLDANGTHSEVFTSDGGLIRIFGRATNSATITVSIKEEIDADFDFTRGSAATRVTKDGLIKNVQILSGELLQNGNFEQIGSELITNGDFDTDSDWTKGSSWTIANGQASYDASGINPITSSTTSIVSGKTYRLKFKITTSGFARLNFTNDSSQVLFEPNGNSVNNFSSGEYTFYLSAQNNSTALRIFAYNNSVGTSFSMDNVSVKEVGQNWNFGTGWSMGDGKAIFNGGNNQSLSQDGIVANNKKYKLTYTISNYVEGGINWRFGSSVNLTPVRSANGTYVEEITSTGSDFRAISSGASELSIDNISVKEITDDTDLPRIDYTNGTGHLLLEPQSTNTATYSNDFTQGDIFNSSADPGTTSAVLTSQQEAAPDGTNNGWLLKDDNDGGTGPAGLRYFSTQVNSDDFNTISIFAKKALSNDFLILENAGYDADGNGTSYFNISNGSLESTSANHTAKIEGYGDGWYRCSITFQTTTDLQGAIYVRLASSSSSINVTKDGTNGVYIFGLQCEADASQNFPTSYIPTNGSTVTRNADVCNNSGSSDLINSTEGVLYAEIAALADDLTNRVISLSDGTSNERVVLQFHNTTNRIRCFIKSGGSFYATLDKVVSDITDFHKIAYKYKSGETKLFVDGSLITSSSNTFSITGLNVLQFANGTPTASPFYGNVRSVAVFKEALTDEELAKITSTTQQEVFYEMRDKMLQINADYYEFGDYTTRLKKLF